MTQQPVEKPASDWVRRPGMGFVWWCLPLAVGFSANYFSSSPRGTGLVWIAAFIWMGTGCILNARRCHRLHCYISGPAFLLGAAALVLLEAGVPVLGAHSLSNIVAITLAVVLLSFVPEIWRKYL